jgi:chromosomal replication initiation ATPase DnaA
LQDVPEQLNLIKKFYPTIEEVIRVVVDYFNVTYSSVLNNDKGRKLLARKYAIFLSQRLTGESQRIIGKKFGGLTYSTVSKISKAVEISMKESDMTLKQINELKEILSNFKT